MFNIFDNNPNVLVQGITGKHGSYHTEAMLKAGTRVVAGVTPGGAGKMVSDVPVFNTISEAQQEFSIDISVVFVPTAFCKNAIIEAIEARIPVIVCITEGLPVHDAVEVKRLAIESGIRLVGPNCPGILLPGSGRYGIIPENIGLPGDISVVSRSGTLAYEVTNALTVAGIGQRIILGIGGDPVKGTGFVDTLEEFEADSKTKAIVLVGEIGGQDEVIAANCIKENVTKPVYAYVAGHYAPLGKQLGHAGAVIRSSDETAASKTKALNQSGVKTANTVDELVELLISDILI